MYTSPLWIRKLSAFLNYRLPVYATRLVRGTPEEQPIPDLSRQTQLRFLVIKLDGAGDVLLTSPMYRALREAFPDSSCTVVVQERNRALLAHNAFVNEVLSPPVTTKRSALLFREVWTLINFYRTTLSKRQFDVVIHPRWDTDVFHGTLLLTLINSQIKIGYVDSTSASKQDFNGGFERSLTARLPPGNYNHELMRNLGPVKAILESSGITNEIFPRTELFLDNADRKFAASLISVTPKMTRLVGIAIGAQDQRRVWPMELWVDTLRLLAGEYTLYPLILCIASDRPRAQKLQDGLNGRALIVDRTTWTEAAAVLEHVDLVLANDSGMGHIASAVKKPVIIVSPHPLFGFEPYGEKVRVLHPTASLAPCSTQCSASEPHCILQVTPQEVAGAARYFLN